MSCLTITTCTCDWEISSLRLLNYNSLLEPFIRVIYKDYMAINYPKRLVKSS